MQNKSKRPILVSGAHRSGTTWVGKTLAKSPSIIYIEEPFSPVVRHYHPGLCNANFSYWWMYITEENEKQYYDEIFSTLNFRYKLMVQIKRIIQNRCGFRTFLKGYTSFSLNRYRNNVRPLLKDPIGLFSAEWLAKRFTMDVVILIRHPAAFVSSIKRMNWPHDFSNFLNQPLLIRDHLKPLEKDIKRHLESDADIIDDGILLWRLFYSFVDKLRKKHKEFLYVKHEDLSRYPVESFQKIFDRLDIEFSEKIKNFIVKSTNSSNPIEASEGIMHQLKRNSRANVKSWKNRLSDSEIIRIKEGVKDISTLYYSEDEWV
jgi:hypothetical protein